MVTRTFNCSYNYNKSRTENYLVLLGRSLYTFWCKCYNFILLKNINAVVYDEI